jgi:hypothetical protein
MFAVWYMNLDFAVSRIAKVRSLAGTQINLLVTPSGAVLEPI